MQEFFLKHKKRIIGAGIAILVLVTVIASGIKLNATLLESAIGVVVTPFQDLTTGISSWIDDTVTSARNKTKLKDENEELKQQIAELTNKNRKLSMYETENERLTAANDRLKGENDALRSELKDFRFMRKVLGSQQIDNLIAQAKEMEQQRKQTQRSRRRNTTFER